MNLLTLPALVLAFGAGAETRIAIGFVLLSGVIAATFLRLYIVPVGYSLLVFNTGSPSDVQRRLIEESRGTEGGMFEPLVDPYRRDDEIISKV